MLRVQPLIVVILSQISNRLSLIFLHQVINPWFQGQRYQIFNYFPLCCCSLLQSPLWCITHISNICMFLFSLSQPNIIISTFNYQKMNMMLLLASNFYNEKIRFQILPFCTRYYASITRLKWKDSRPSCTQLIIEKVTVNKTSYTAIVQKEKKRKERFFTFLRNN